MTGEKKLQERILSMGGLKEKILAAKQHGLKTIIIPQENLDDIEDIKKEMSFDGLFIKFVSAMDEVLKLALKNDPFAIKSKLIKKNAKKTAKKKTKTI